MLKYFLVTLLIISVGCTSSRDNKAKVLKAGLPLEWDRNLEPALQHSAIAAAILGNQFETLVSVGKGGQIIPSAAKSWEIKDGYQEIRFKIDTSRRFSDGSSLVASDFKKAWERGLKDVPRSANNSLLDTLVYIEGFSNFEKTGKLSGVKAEADDVLVLKFTKPFRTALNFMSSPSLAVNKRLKEALIGTGPYIISRNTGKSAVLTKNKFYKDSEIFQRIDLVLLSKDVTEKVLSENVVDLVMYAEITNIPCIEDDEYGCYSGLESSHNFYYINSTEGRIFSQSEHRKAAMFILDKYFSSLTDWNYDPQIFLPLQAGRVDSDKISSLISQGQKYIKKLQEQSKKKPIKILSSGGKKTILNVQGAFKKYNIAFEPAKIVGFPKYLEDYYKNHEYDILLGGASVHHGDPDGIYHVLGKNGAITSPMLARDNVIPLLEEGRKILNHGDLHKHYQKVTKAVIKDIPFFHAGFRTTKTIYSKKRIKMREDLKNRTDFSFSNYTPQ